MSQHNQVLLLTNGESKVGFPGQTHSWVVLLQVVTRGPSCLLPRGFLHLSCDFQLLVFSHLREEGERLEVHVTCSMVTHILISSPQSCDPHLDTQGWEMLLSWVPREEGRSRYGLTLPERIRRIISLLILIQVGLIFWRHVQRRDYISHFTLETFHQKTKLHESEAKLQRGQKCDFDLLLTYLSSAPPS